MKAQGEIVIRRTPGWSLMYIIIMVGIGYQLRNTTESLLVLVGVFGIVLWGAQLIMDLIKKDYIVYAGEQMTITNSFRTWTFNKSDIDYIAINYSPFSRSYFKLKGGQKRYINPWQLSKTDTAKLQLICSKTK
jgi:hypothetical protein